MFSYIYPIFEKKRLLKNEMLENLRDFPRELFDILYQDYSNGILSGAAIIVRSEVISISPGVLFWNGFPYVMSKEFNIGYEATGKYSYLKVKFLNELQSTEKQEYLTQIYLDDKPINELNEMELARYKLQSGAKLRGGYTDFFDYDTEFDTVNRIHVPFASLNRNTIWPEILKIFAQTIMKTPIKSPWDYSFCMNCLHLERGMNYEEIKSYLNVRLEETKTDYSNQEIYWSLKKIIQEVKGTGKMQNMDSDKQKKMLLL